MAPTVGGPTFAPILTAMPRTVPNHFFDVSPNSHSCVRLVAYVILRTLGRCDANGSPQENQSSRRFVGDVRSVARARSELLAVTKVVGAVTRVSIGFLANAVRSLAENASDVESMNCNVICPPIMEACQGCQSTPILADDSRIPRCEHRTHGIARFSVMADFRDLRFRAPTSFIANS